MYWSQVVLDAPFTRFSSEPQEEPAEERQIGSFLTGRWTEIAQFLQDGDDSDLLEQPLFGALLLTARARTEQHGIERLLALASRATQEPDLACAAAILAGQALSDSDQIDQAIEALETTELELPADAVGERFLLQHQRVFRLVQAARFPEAIELERALVWPGVFEGGDGFEALDDAFKANREALTRLRSSPMTSWTSSDQSQAWRRVEQQLSAAHSRLLDEYYELEVRDTASSNRPMTFRSVDLVEQPLIAYKNSAELTGYIRRYRHSCYLLGRERMLRAGEVSVESVRESLRLLRRSGERKHAQSALLKTRSEGPVAALVPEVRLAARNVSARSSRIDNATLRIGADLLSPQEAQNAVIRLLDIDQPWIRDQAGQYRSDEVIGSVTANLTRVADDHEEIGERLLRKSEASTDPARNLQRPLYQLRWGSISLELRNRWRGWAENHLADENQPAATDVLVCLARAGDESSVSPLLSRFSETQDLDSASALVDLLVHGQLDGDEPVLDDVAELCVRWIDSAIKESKQGSFSYGGVDVPFMAELLLERKWVDQLGDAVGRFVSRASVSPVQKERVLDRLAAYPQPNILPEPPPNLEAILWPNTEAWSNTLFFVGRSSAAGYRYLCSREIISPQFATKSLLEMAGSTESAARHEAALSLAFAAPVVSQDFLVATAFQLCSDVAVLVRAAAARQFIRLVAVAREPNLLPLLSNRLVPLMAEPGTSVPLAIVEGLGDLEDGSEAKTFLTRSLFDETHLNPAVSASRNVRLALDRLLANGGNPAVSAADDI